MKDDVQIPGFNTFSNAAQKTYKNKTGRLTGGLVLGYKNYLRNGISFLKSHDNYIWCKLNRTFFNLEQDVYLCALYIPPHDSPYFDPELFSNIETDIALFHRKGLIVLAGDFNPALELVKKMILSRMKVASLYLLAETFLHHPISLKDKTLITFRDRGGGGAGSAAAPPLFCAPAPHFLR